MTETPEAHAPTATSPPNAPPIVPKSPDWARWLIAVLGIAFTALLIWATVRGDFLAEGAALVTMPWGRVSLADLYLGFVLYALAVCLVERGNGARAFWALPVFIIGNVWSALWIVVRWKVILARFRD
jgi:hypothetical protein